MFWLGFQLKICLFLGDQGPVSNTQYVVGHHKSQVTSVVYLTNGRSIYVNL